MKYRDIFDTGAMEPEREKIIERRKKILAKFIGCDTNEIIFDDGCYDNDLYKYKGRYYHCASLKNHEYGDPWYPKNQWRDIDGHRCSIGYYLIRSERDNSWTIYIGNQEAYTWKNRTTNYKKKTAKQIRQLALWYTNEMIKNCKGDYEPKVVFTTIEEHFWQLFGRWFDGRNCKLEKNMEGN